MPVERVEAYRTSDGKVHLTEADALKAEAYEQLKKTGVFQHNTIEAIILWRDDVMKALRPLGNQVVAGSYAETAPDAGSLEQLASPPQSESTNA